MVLGFSEMASEDRPPDEIWLDEPRLIAHFEARAQARNEKYGTKAKDDDDSMGRDWEDSMIQNELANQMLRDVGVKPT